MTTPTNYPYWGIRREVLLFDVRVFKLRTLLQSSTTAIPIEPLSTLCSENK
jgi:hypothetical protein